MSCVLKVHYAKKGSKDMIRCDPSHPVQPPLKSKSVQTKNLQWHKDILSNQKKKKIIHHSSSLSLSIFLLYFLGTINQCVCVCVCVCWGGATRNVSVQGWHSGYEGMMPTKAIPTSTQKKVQISHLSIHVLTYATKTNPKFNSIKKGNIKSINNPIRQLSFPPQSRMPLFSSAQLF